MSEAAKSETRADFVHARAFMSAPIQHCLPSCRTSALGGQGGAAILNSVLFFNETMTNECVTNLWAGVTR